MKITTTLAFVFALLSSICAQPPAPNLLKNPSFERGEVGPGKTPRNWKNCGEKGHSPVDVHYSLAIPPIFGVRAQAAQGDYYLGMVARSDGSTECIYQKFKDLVPPGNFQLSLWVALPETMDNMDILTRKPASYAHPIGLEIVGIAPDDEAYLLGSIPSVSEVGWQRLSFEGLSDVTFKGLAIRTVHTGGNPYNGYVLVDEVEFSVE